MSLRAGLGWGASVSKPGALQEHRPKLVPGTHGHVQYTLMGSAQERKRQEALRPLMSPRPVMDPA